MAEDLLKEMQELASSPQTSSVNPSLSDDLSGAYIDKMRLQEEQIAGNELLQEMEGMAQVEQPSTNDALREARMQPTEWEPAAAILGIDEGTPPNNEESTLRKAAKDIAVGIAETPRGIVSGVVDAGNELLQTVYDLGAKLREMGIGPNGYFEFGEDGISWKEGSVPEDKRIQLPNLAEPSSVTAGMVHDISQWLTGFALASRIKPFAAAAKGGTAAKIAGAAGAGAVTDFAFMDDQQNRLASIFQGTPLENDFTEWLASKEGDAVDNRFKNTVEGLGLGAFTELAFQGMRAMRNWMTKKPSGSLSADFSPVQEEVVINQSALDSLMGKKPRSERLPTEEDKLAKSEKELQAGPVGDKEPYINWAKIEAPEDILALMKERADSYSGNISKEQRGVMSFKVIQDKAAGEDAWKTLMQRRTGEPLNAEQSVAARELWVSATDKLAEVAEIAAANPTAANLFAFRKMLVIQNAVQKEVMGARTETARALASWRIPVGSSTAAAKQMQDLIDQSGGIVATQDLAQKVYTLFRSGMVQQAAKVAELGWWARTRNALMEAWINGLLSSPITHSTNIVSNAAFMGMAMAERKFSNWIGKFFNPEDLVSLNESTAMLSGVLGSARDAMRYAGKSFIMNESGYGVGKIEGVRPGSISSEAFNLRKDSFFGKSVDLIGSAVRLPGRFLRAEDEFFKTINYRAEVHASAHRTAVDEANRGIIQPSQIQDRYRELIDNPPDYIRQQAIDFAQYQTFTNKAGTAVEAISRLANNNLLLRILLPFIRTPANIFNASMERSPFAPLTQRFRQEVSAGGHRADLALAKMSLGSMAMLSAVDLAMNGYICGSGPSEPGEKQLFMRQWGPGGYRFKYGDQTYQYNRLDPLGFLLGISADLVDLMRRSNSEETGRSAENLLTASIFALANNAANKSYMATLSRFIDAMNNADRTAQSFMNSLAGSVIPSKVAKSKQMMDPYVKEIRSMADSLMSRTPGLSDSLPPRRDLWGRPRLYTSGNGWVFDMFSPIASAEYGDQPIDQELSRLQYYPQEIGYKVTFSDASGQTSARLNLELYPGSHSRLVELAGNSLKLPQYEDKGCMDFLNDLVQGKSTYSAIYEMYSDGPDGEKSRFIQKIISDFRKEAKLQLVKEFPQMEPDINFRLEKARQLKFPQE